MPIIKQYVECANKYYGQDQPLPPGAFARLFQETFIPPDLRRSLFPSLELADLMTIKDIPTMDIYVLATMLFKLGTGKRWTGVAQDLDHPSLYFVKDLLGSCLHSDPEKRASWQSTEVMLEALGAQLKDGDELTDEDRAFATLSLEQRIRKWFGLHVAVIADGGADEIAPDPSAKRRKASDAAEELADAAPGADSREIVSQDAASSGQDLMDTSDTEPKVDTPVFKTPLAPARTLRASSSTLRADKTLLQTQQANASDDVHAELTPPVIDLSKQLSDEDIAKFKRYVCALVDSNTRLETQYSDIPNHLMDYPAALELVRMFLFTYLVSPPRQLTCYCTASVRPAAPHLSLMEALVCQAQYH